LGLQEMSFTMSSVLPIPKVTLGQYVNQLKQVTVLRLLKQLSEVFSTLKVGKPWGQAQSESCTTGSSTYLQLCRWNVHDYSMAFAGCPEHNEAMVNPEVLHTAAQQQKQGTGSRHAVICSSPPALCPCVTDLHPVRPGPLHAAQ
jgi:hypothetical protein